MNEQCSLIQSLMADAITVSLAPDQVRQVQEHVVDCPACRSYQDALEVDDRLLAQFADAARPVVDGIEANVIRRLNASATGERTGRSVLRKDVLSWKRVRFAAAAAIIFGILALAVHSLWPLSTPATTLAQTLDAMRGMSWIHVVETPSSVAGSVRESWECFKPHITARKTPDGQFVYSNYADNVRYSYNPNANKITISFATDNDMIGQPETPFERLAQHVQLAQESRAKATRKTVDESGVRVEMISLDYANNPHCEAVLFVRDVGRNLLTRTETTVLRDGQRSTVTEIYDYPKQGPADIYALGVPRDALVRDIRSEGPALVLGDQLPRQFDQGLGDDALASSVAEAPEPNAPTETTSAQVEPLDDAEPPAETGLGGLVKDERGKPVSDATVLLYYSRSRWGLGNKVAQTALTGPDGRFALGEPIQFERREPHAYAQDSYVLLALHPDHAFAWRSITQGRENESYELTLTAPTTRAITVTDHNDTPLAGARVWLYNAGDRTSTNPLFRDYLSLSTDPGFIGSTTDAAGNATITNLPATACCFHATLKGYATGLTFPNQDRIRLSPGANVSGWVVTDAGDPVEGASISFAADWMNNYFLAQTDSQGHFEYSDLPAKGWDMSPWGESVSANGAYAIRVKHADYATSDKTIELLPGQVVDDMVIQVAAETTLVRCLVVEEGTDNPVPGARISGRADGLRISGYSDVNGVFEVRVLPGPAELSFYSPPDGVYIAERSNEHRLSFVAEGPQMTVTLKAPPVTGRLATVIGTVYGPDGQPVPDAVVYGAAGEFHTATAGSYIRPAGANADGRFELKEVPAGRDLCVYVETKDRTLAMAGVFAIVADVNELTPLELVLQPTVAAVTAIQDDESNLVPGLSVEIAPFVGNERMWPAGRTKQIDEASVLQMDGAIPGLTYHLRDARFDQLGGRLPEGEQKWFERQMVLVPLEP